MLLGGDWVRLVKERGGDQLLTEGLRFPVDDGEEAEPVATAPAVAKCPLFYMLR